MSKEIEEWRPVVGYEGLYEVSDWGNVRSLNRVIQQYNASAGRVVDRHFKGQLLKKVLNFEGYHIVTLSHGKQGKVHRLVAEAWIPNPENKNEVGHLKTLPDGTEDKTANEVWNLQWMTRKENANYGTIGERIANRMTGDKNPMKKQDVAAKVAEKQRINGMKRYLEDPDKFIEMMNSNRKVGDEKRKIKVIQIDNNTGEVIKTWDSAADVERELGICHANVAACCRGKNKTAGGFKWKYYD